VSAGKGSFAYAGGATLLDPAPSSTAGGAAPKTHPWPPIDPTKNQIITIIGKKGSGKSVAARHLFRSWPGSDRLIIDITGDADPGDDMNAIRLPQDLTRLPAFDPNQGPQVYRWIPDTRSATFRDDIDRALGAGLYPKDRPVLVWVDEKGEAFKANQTGPHGRTALHQGRHHKLSMILCGPRAMGVEPLCISQGDRVLMYDVPNPADRERIAANIGVSPRVLTAELNETKRRGPYWYLMYVAAEDQLYRCPPLPHQES